MFSIQSHILLTSYKCMLYYNARLPPDLFQYGCFARKKISGMKGFWQYKHVLNRIVENVCRFYIFN